MKLENKIRKLCLQMAYSGKASHLASSLSVIEILISLYCNILKVNAREPEWPDRDRFIMSKGHAAAALYAVMAEIGYFPAEMLKSYYKIGSKLPGHVTHCMLPGIEASTGALGHGLSISAGMAIVAKRERRRYRIFCCLSDGECDEGSTWEAAMFAAHHALDNLVAIIDYNKFQALGPVNQVLKLEPFCDKWKAFGWAVNEVDGHNIEKITKALKYIPYKKGKPSCLIAHTIKGKGISFMENNILWHYRVPNDKEYEIAIKELEEKE
jgi:transketolase